MSHRRAIAPLIRARQELRKRLDRLRIPSGPAVLPAGPPQVPALSASRSGLPDAARRELLAEAEAVRNGTWQVFGDTATAFSASGDWRAHPVSGTPTPLRHWTTLRYLDGEAGGDVKQIWELNRHRGLLRLAQAWYLERDPRWLVPLSAHLDSWMAQNPAGEGINWASSLEVGFRALAWTWIRALTAGSDLWTQERDGAFASQLWQHGRHIACYDSIHHSPNTHLTGEALGLVQLAYGWPEWTDASGWAGLGETILREELEHQLLADGMHFELAPGYHRYSTEFYLIWMVLLKRSGRPIPPELTAALSLMLDTLAALRRPDGLLPGIGDEDGGSTLPLSTAHPRDPAPVLWAGAGLLGRSEWAWGLDPGSRDLSWWILDDADWQTVQTMQPVRPSWTARSFPVSGYFLSRETQEPGWWCLVDAGAHGGDRTGHAHTDLGHVELMFDGRPIVTDPGSLVYTCSEARRGWDRSAEAHATLSVAGAPLAEPAGPFGWRQIAPTPAAGLTSRPDGAIIRLAYEWLAADGSRLSHERQVALLAGSGVVIVDWLDGAAAREVTMSWPLLMTPADIQLEAAGASLAGGEVRLRWTTAGGEPFSAALTAVPFAGTYRTPVAASMLSLSSRAEGAWMAVAWFAAGTRPLDAVIAGREVDITTGGGQRVRLIRGVA